MEKLYARDIYGKTLVEIGKQDQNLIVCDADLSGSTRTSLFRKEFPDRFLNFGVAEQNMMAASAGLASCGKIVFASTFAMFASARALDQVRNTICYNGFNVKIVATHGGITVGEDGASHQALEDVNCLRAIPNMRIIVPADAPEAREAVITAYKTKGPFYIRLGRSKVSTIENRPQFELGKGYVLQDGSDVGIIACGILVHEALQARQILAEKGISAAVASMPTIKPIDEKLLKEFAQRFKMIFVCEEHQVIGGLYSAVCEFLSRTNPIRVEPIAVENRFGQSGLPNELLKAYGLSSDCIAQKIEKAIR